MIKLTSILKEYILREESIEFSAVDLELAKRLEDFDIVIEITDTYEIRDKNDTKKDFDQVTIINTTKQTIQNTLHRPIPKDPQKIEEILFNEFEENDFDLESLGNNEVVEEIPKGWHKAFLLNIDIDVKIYNQINESFEFSDDDLKLAKKFDRRKLKVGDYFNDSSNPKWAGAWGELEDVPSQIHNLVKKIIYIGPNKGKYEEPAYYDQDIVVFEFAIDPEHIYTFTVNYFNKELTDKINAYIPTENLNESFEFGPEDMELARRFNTKYLKQGDTIKPEMWDPSKINNLRFTDIDFDYPWKITDFDEDWSGEDGEPITITVFLGDGEGYEIYEYLDNVNLWLKPEFQIKRSLDESFEFGPEDLKLAKRFNNEPEIQVDVHLIYNWNSDSKAFPSVPNHETTYRLQYSISDLTKLIEKYSPYETYTADEIPSKLKDKAFLEVLYESLLELAYEELGQLADLYGYRSSHLVEEWIQDKAYKVFNPINWSKFPQDAWNLDEMEVTADLIKPLNRVKESIEFGPEDMELARRFNMPRWVGGTYENFEEWAMPILQKAGYNQQDIDDFLQDVIASWGDSEYEGITLDELFQEIEGWLSY